MTYICYLLFQAEFNKKNTYYIFNHVDITISYHSLEESVGKGARLVGATLEPRRFENIKIVLVDYTNHNKIDQNCRKYPIV